jgi:two-component system NarL family response regulator
MWIRREVIADVIHMLPGRESSAMNSSIHFGLTSRQMEIVLAVVHGLGNKEIAEKLGISQFTVKHYMTQIFDKLLVSNRTELALFAVRQGLAKNAGKVVQLRVPKGQ